jgi:hypothetical protein
MRFVISQQPPPRKNDDFCTACLTGVCLCCCAEGAWPCCYVPNFPGLTGLPDPTGRALRVPLLSTGCVVDARWCSCKHSMVYNKLLSALLGYLPRIANYDDFVLFQFRVYL